MAKNKKQPIISSGMKGKVFDSFSALGAALGIKPNVQEDNYSKKCKYCGTEMVNIPGTNVWVCHGKNEEGKDCGNRVTARVRPAM